LEKALRWEEIVRFYFLYWQNCWPSMLPFLFII
jgi:hypothetical protein